MQPNDYQTGTISETCCENCVWFNTDDFKCQNPNSKYNGQERRCDDNCGECEF